MIDHLYYVVTHTSPGQLRREWWSSSVRHICDQHTHQYELFPECRHGEQPVVVDDDGHELQPAYIDPGLCNNVHHVLVTFFHILHTMKRFFCCICPIYWFWSVMFMNNDIILSFILHLLSLRTKDTGA